MDEFDLSWQCFLEIGLDRSCRSRAFLQNSTGRWKNSRCNPIPIITATTHMISRFRSSTRCSMNGSTFSSVIAGFPSADVLARLCMIPQHSGLTATAFTSPRPFCLPLCWCPPFLCRTSAAYPLQESSEIPWVATGSHEVPAQPSPPSDKINLLSFSAYLVTPTLTCSTEKPLGWFSDQGMS